MRESDLLSARAKQAPGTWALSPYPNGHDCAFTIVHDADDAYSRRLAPLFDVFDEYRIKVTVTTFAFWAEWARHGAVWETWRRGDVLWDPKCVPLEDPDELAFYQELAARGHEIALHTASDTDATRDQTIQAFDFFRSGFGCYPRTYVEHRESRQNQRNCGATPDSPYYVTDVLNQYGPWCWIVSPSALPYGGRGRYYDLLSSQLPPAGWFLVRQWGTVKAFLKTRSWDPRNGWLFELMLRGGTPFDNYAREKFGVLKTFRRCGRSHHGDGGGHGFLRWYPREHVDQLVQHQGLAIAYTHLNTGWLDRETRAMRSELRDCLAYLAAQNVWLAPAADILDRFQQLQHVMLVPDASWLKIVNGSDVAIDGLTIRRIAAVSRQGHKDRRAQPAADKIVLGRIEPRQTIARRLDDLCQRHE